MTSPNINLDLNFFLAQDSVDCVFNGFVYVSFCVRWYNAFTVALTNGFIINHLAGEKSLAFALAFRSMPLTTVDLPGHKKPTLPPLRRPQHALIPQLKTALPLYRFKALLPNARSRATRVYLHENGRSIAHLTSAKTAGPARLVEMHPRNSL